MGQEIRRVPPSWQHPKNQDGNYIPLEPSWNEQLAAEWDLGFAQWQKGLRRAVSLDLPQHTDPVVWVPIDPEDAGHTYEKYCGKRPDYRDHMPSWSISEATHYQLYENVTEGTPISPVFRYEGMCWKFAREAEAKKKALARRAKRLKKRDADLYFALRAAGSEYFEAGSEEVYL